jgi:hypothetical protein
LLFKILSRRSAWTRMFWHLCSSVTKCYLWFLWANKYLFISGYCEHHMNPYNHVLNSHLVNYDVCDGWCKCPNCPQSTGKLHDYFTTIIPANISAWKIVMWDPKENSHQKQNLKKIPTMVTFLLYFSLCFLPPFN